MIGGRRFGVEKRRWRCKGGLIRSGWTGRVRMEGLLRRVDVRWLAVWAMRKGVEGRVFLVEVCL